MASGNAIFEASADVMQYDGSRQSWVPTAGSGSSNVIIMQYLAGIFTVHVC